MEIMLLPFAVIVM